MKSRHEQMLEFLHNHLTAGFSIESLPGDASFRRYHRIFMPHSLGEKQISYLLMDAPPEKESVIEFIHVAQIMSEVVNVPDILAKDVAAGFLLLQDFGTVEFAHLIAQDDKNKNSYYTQALDALSALQKLGNHVDLPFYDADKLTQEMNLFGEWFLSYLQVDMDENAQMLWCKLQQSLIQDILQQPQVVVHRDYHSRNLMLDKSSGLLGVIDFQDALIGAYTYDLVSLVRDAYVDYDETWVQERILQFYQLIQPEVDFGSFVSQVNIMGVQRHLKVLGIFIRLSQRDGKHRYLQNIPKVMKDLKTEIDWLIANTQNPIYQQFLDWLNEFVMPKYEHHFIKSENNLA